MNITQYFIRQKFILLMVLTLNDYRWFMQANARSLYVVTFDPCYNLGMSIFRPQPQFLQIPHFLLKIPKVWKTTLTFIILMFYSWISGDWFINIQHLLWIQTYSGTRYNLNCGLKKLWLTDTVSIDANSQLSKKNSPSNLWMIILTLVGSTFIYWKPSFYWHFVKLKM